MEKHKLRVFFEKLHITAHHCTACRQAVFRVWKTILYDHIFSFLKRFANYFRKELAQATLEKQGECAMLRCNGQVCANQFVYLWFA